MRRGILSVNELPAAPARGPNPSGGSVLPPLADLHVAPVANELVDQPPGLVGREPVEDARNVGQHAGELLGEPLLGPEPMIEADDRMRPGAALLLQPGEDQL